MLCNRARAGGGWAGGGNACVACTRATRAHRAVVGCAARAKLHDRTRTCAGKAPAVAAALRRLPRHPRRASRRSSSGCLRSVSRGLRGGVVRGLEDAARARLSAPACARRPVAVYRPRVCTILRGARRFMRVAAGCCQWQCAPRICDGGSATLLGVRARELRRPLIQSLTAAAGRGARRSALRAFEFGGSGGGRGAARVGSTSTPLSEPGADLNQGGPAGRRERWSRRGRWRTDSEQSTCPTESC